MAVVAHTTTAWRWPATGTTWQVHHSGGVGAALARRATGAVATDEARWSRFVSTSDVSRVTRGAGSPVCVGRETVELVATAVRWLRATGGVFSPLVGQALVDWGYADSLLARQPGCAVSPTATPVSGEPVIDPVAGTISIPPGTALDLGGIGKAWMARRLGALLAASCDDPLLLVDAGGDLTAARGEHLVAVEHPGDPAGSPLAAVRLREGDGVATSGDGRRRWQNGDGGIAHHLIDPSTGAPAAPAHATVVADDVVAADVLAKVLVLRPELIASIAEPAVVLVEGGQRFSGTWRTVVAE